jgi:fluoride ion exporter CrcB/FEX
MLRYGAGVVIKSVNFLFHFHRQYCWLFHYWTGVRHRVEASRFVSKLEIIPCNRICGGFTTFSAFSIEGVQMLQQGRYLIFFLYFALSIILGLTATWLGVRIVQA